MLGSPRSKWQQIRYLVRAFFLVLRQPASLHVLTWQKDKRAFWDLFYKGTNPIHVDSALMI